MLDSISSVYSMQKCISKYAVTINMKWLQHHSCAAH